VMDFIRFAASHGIEIERLYPADGIRRCPTTTHPHKKNGAYFFDGRRGFVWNWETGGGVQWWNDPNSRGWSEQEKRAWADRQRRSRQARERRQADAAIKASDLLRSAVIDHHGYLKYKALADIKGLVLPDGSLMIPMRDCQTNALIGAQIISLVNNEFEKKMLYGQRSKGAIFRIGHKNAPEAILCEGYATGLSIELAAKRLSLDTSVLVCFSASNLVYVANLIGGRKMVFADNDKSFTGERAALETGLPYVISNTDGHDANDDHKKFGILSVCNKLMELRAQ
jgi:putative DNA primase/helicase